MNTDIKMVGPKPVDVLTQEDYAEFERLIMGAGLRMMLATDDETHGQCSKDISQALRIALSYTDREPRIKLDVLSILTPFVTDPVIVEFKHVYPELFNLYDELSETN